MPISKDQWNEVKKMVAPFTQFELSDAQKIALLDRVLERVGREYEGRDYEDGESPDV